MLVAIGMSCVAHASTSFYHQLIVDAIANSLIVGSLRWHHFDSTRYVNCEDGWCNARLHPLVQFSYIDSADDPPWQQSSLGIRIVGTGGSYSILTPSVELWTRAVWLVDESTEEIVFAHTFGGPSEPQIVTKSWSPPLTGPLRTDLPVTTWLKAYSLSSNGSVWEGNTALYAHAFNETVSSLMIDYDARASRPAESSAALPHWVPRLPEGTDIEHVRSA